MDHVPEGTVTLLFADLEGSTHLLQQVGEDQYNRLLADYRHLLRTTFTSWHGYEVDTQGDAFFVAFARATDAVSAAIATQRTLSHHPWPEGGSARVRIGLHTGHPQRTTQGYIGVDVHQAARIMSAGSGGQVLLSQAVVVLVEPHLPDDARLQDLGIHRLKDLSRPIRLFQLAINGLPTDFPPLKTLENRTHNLPVQPTAFLGREQELTRLRDLLLQEEVRLVTLTGPAGVGKTRLGLQVAASLIEQFHDGVFLVSLAPVSEPSQVIPTIIQTLSLREQGTLPPLAALSAALRDKHLLLLFDNFEQVAEAALQVAALLASCPRLKILVTSRVKLRLQAEREVIVPPLSLPEMGRLPDVTHLSQYEAIAFFIERARTIKADFELTEATAPVVAAICTRLDGLPLAIELTAARIRYFSLPQLLRQLDHALAVLSQGARDLPARQQTLRGAMAWSYLLLSSQEQQLFRRLAVFVGSCSVQAAACVCTAASPLEGEILEGMLSLVDKSLLWPVEHDEHSPRFRMLQLVRAFGLECLESVGETEVTRQAHATYYLQLAEESTPSWNTPEQRQWHALFEQEHENLRLALSFLLEGAHHEGSAGHLKASQALRLCLALHEFWWVRGYFREARTFFERALSGWATVPPETAAEALYRLGSLEVRLNDYEQAQIHLSQSLELSQQSGDVPGQARCLVALGLVAHTKSEYETAHTELTEADALSQQAGLSGLQALGLTYLARTFMAQGDYGQAQALLEESLRLYRAEKSVYAALPLRWLAEVFFATNQDLARAEDLAQQSLTIWMETGEKAHSADALYTLGEIRLGRGKLAEARAVLEQSQALFQEVGDSVNRARGFIGLARVNALQKDVPGAYHLYHESLAQLRELGSPLFIPPALEGWGEVIAMQGEPMRAAQLWGAAEALREKHGIPMRPVERRDYERAVAEVRAQLGEKVFAETMDRGREMTLEEILSTESKAPLTASSPQQSEGVAPPGQSPSLPDGLTVREGEVLRLVAAGLTDAQIAQRLVISPRTVNTHLTSIYSKIGVPSRSSATRYAIEHHLL